MPTVVRGVVKAGIIVPDRPLPEGLMVEITFPDAVPEVPPDLQEELDAWALGSAESLALVERLADEGAGDDKG